MASNNAYIDDEIITINPEENEEELQEVTSDERNRHVEAEIIIRGKEPFRTEYIDDSMTDGNELCSTTQEEAVKIEKKSIFYSKTGFKSVYFPSNRNGAEEKIPAFNVPNDNKSATNYDLHRQAHQQATEDGSCDARMPICTRIFNFFSKFYIYPWYSDRSEEKENLLGDEQRRSENLEIPRCEDKLDIVIIYAEEDSAEVTKYKTHLEVQFGAMDLQVEFFESVLPCNQSKLSSIPDLFQICRFIFIYMTQNFTEAELEKYQAEIALLDAITNHKQRDRIVPVWADKTAEDSSAVFRPLRGSRYYKVKDVRGNISQQAYFDHLERLLRYGRSTY